MDDIEEIIASELSDMREDDLREAITKLRDVIGKAVKDYDKRKMTYGWHDLQAIEFKKVLKDTKDFEK